MTTAKHERAPRRCLPARLRVRSATDPTVKHYVYVNASGMVTCSCPAGAWRKPCRHAEAVLVMTWTKTPDD